jgi:hypothetical protein
MPRNESITPLSLSSAIKQRSICTNGAMTIDKSPVVYAHRIVSGCGAGSDIPGTKR